MANQVREITVFRTSDGREFDKKKDAERWQNIVNLGEFLHLAIPDNKNPEDYENPWNALDEDEFKEYAQTLAPRAIELIQLLQNFVGSEARLK